MKIVIIDYGAGNTKSVEYALNRIGVKATLTANLIEVKNADGVIFPGVGHASSAMRSLKEKGLDLLIPELKQPVLGICLGMQLMCSSSEEGGTKGLGIFQEKAIKFQNDLKVPQIGWNKLKIREDNDLLERVDREFVYFVHSYYVPVSQQTIGKTEYGVEFSAALQKDNFYGCQFHPEKSSLAGEKILKNFISICESYQQ